MSTNVRPPASLTDSAETLRIDLRERNKELRALYETCRLTECADVPVNDVLGQVCVVLKAGFLHTDQAEVRIRVAGRDYATPAFVETPWTQVARFADGDTQGDVTVAYLEQMPEAFEGPFLREERELLDAVARHLASVLTRQHLARTAARHERTARMISACSSALIRATDEQSVLDQICRIVVEQGQFKLAWVGFAEQDDGKTVRAVACAGPAAGYLRGLDVTWADVERGRGPGGTAIRERRTVVVRFLQTDPSFEPWRPAAIAHGLLSACVVPLLLDDGSCMGALCIYSELPDAFGDEEEALLAALAREISYGIRVQREHAALVRSEAEVKHTAERLQHLLNVSATIIYRLHIEGDHARPVEVSANVTTLLGYSLAETLAPGWWLSHVHPDDRAAAQLALGAVLAGESTVHEYRFASADGRWRWIRDELRLLRDAQGKPREIIGNWSDGTERHDQEAMVRQLSMVVEQITNTVIITDLDGCITYVNDAFVRSTGYPKHDAVGRSVGLLRSGKTPQSTYDELWRTLRSEQPWTGEFINKTRDGRLQVLRSHILPLRADDGRVTHYVAVHEDISEQRQTDERLRKLSQAVEQSPESIVISNLAAELEYVNDAFLRATGYSREEVIGKNPRMLQSGKTPPATYQAMWAVLREGGTWKGQFVNRRKDGSEYVEFAIIAPIRDAQGNVTHYLAVKDDITEKRRLAQELDRHRFHLQELVRSRTEQLAEATERAEAANRAKSAFLANMSHEIRTPLSAIIGFAHLMQRDDPTPAQLARARKIDASAQHLLSVINDILDLSKVEAGKIVLEQVAFDPRTLIYGAFEAFRVRAEGTPVVVSCVLDPALPPILRGDPLRLTQVLLNLGGNAVKFTAEGAVTLRAQVVAERPNGVDVRIEVSDTGIGLSREQVGRLFQPFVQADDSTTRRFGGTGLGLAICVRLIELMGGTYGVESELGVGSTFWCTLPLAVATQLPSDAHALSRVVAARAPGPLRLRDELRVLVVEDDPVNQEVALELLASAGYRVDLAANGALALERAAATPYDLILCDLQMPVMDGLDAARGLRRMPEYAQTPIVAMTANVYQDDRQRCLEAGMSDFVAKPFDPDLFLALVARWTRSMRRVETSPRAAPQTAPGLREQLADALDVEAGLRSFQGNGESYLRVLRQYARGRAGDVAALRGHLALGAVHEAQRIAHTLKGAAASLGAEKVRHAAGALETALRVHAASAAVAPLVDELDLAQQRLVHALVFALPAEVSASETAIDWEAVRVHVAYLLRLVAEDDLEAGAVFRAHAPALRAALGPAADALGVVLEACNFPEARRLLEAEISRYPQLAAGPTA